VPLLISLFSNNKCCNLSLSFSTPYRHGLVGGLYYTQFFLATFSTAFCLLICGGSMLARTGSHCVGVDYTVPEITRMFGHRSLLLVFDFPTYC